MNGIKMPVAEATLGPEPSYISDTTNPTPYQVQN